MFHSKQSLPSTKTAHKRVAKLSRRIKVYSHLSKPVMQRIIIGSGLSGVAAELLGHAPFFIPSVIGTAAILLSLNVAGHGALMKCIGRPAIAKAVAEKITDEKVKLCLNVLASVKRYYFLEQELKATYVLRHRAQLLNAIRECATLTALEKKDRSLTRKMAAELFKEFGISSESRRIATHAIIAVKDMKSDSMSHLLVKSKNISIDVSRHGTNGGTSWAIKVIKAKP